MGPSIFRITIVACFLWGCSAVHQTNTFTVVTTPTPGQTCTDYGKYNDVEACQTATQAYCETETTLFSNGDPHECYVMVAGGENCLTIQASALAPQWIYAAGTAWCRNSPSYYPTGGYPFTRLRSVVGCSSAVCLCLTPESLETATQCTSSANCSAQASPPNGTEECCASSLAGGTCF